MFIIGANLLGLIEGYSICDPKSWDNFSISLSLGANIYRCDGNAQVALNYGSQDMSRYFIGERLDGGELSLAPGECVLANSSEKICMPLGYIGFLQTKGTLARMFVMAHCTDSQVEPGFTGCITLELCNLSCWTIKIQVGAPIAQLFVARCSMEASHGYDGKYSNFELPTIPMPFVRGSSDN